MTKQRAQEYLEWLLRLVVPLMLALFTYVLNNISEEFRGLKAEIYSMRGEYISKISELTIEVATLKAKFDSSQKLQ